MIAYIISIIHTQRRLHGYAMTTRLDVIIIAITKEHVQGYFYWKHTVCICSKNVRKITLKLLTSIIVVNKPSEYQLELYACGLQLILL